MSPLKKELEKDYYKIIFENSEEGIWLIDENSQTIIANNKLAQMLGYTPEEMRGRSIFEFMNEDQVEKAKESVRRRRVGVREQHEFLLQTKDKKLIWTLMASSPINDSKGNYLGAVAFVSNSTIRKRSEVFLKAQNQILKLLATDGSLKDALNLLIISIETVFPGVRGSVLLLNDDLKTVHCTSAPSLPVEFALALDGLPIGPQEGSCGTAMFIKKKVLVSDIANDPLWARYKILALKHELKACWANPIVSHNGNVLGSFAMYFNECREPSLDELQLVDDFTAAAMLSIEYTQTREREKREKRRSTLLADTREVLAQSLDFQNGLRHIPKVLVKDFADLCFIILPNQTETPEVFIAGVEELVQIFSSFNPDMTSKYGLAQAMREKSSVLFSKASEKDIASIESKIKPKDQYYLDQLKKLGLTSYMAAPFVVRGKVVGGISVFSSKRDKVFNKLDLEILEQVAVSCAMTIDNSNLYNEAQKTIKSREEFISVASHELRTPLTSIKLRLDLLNRMITTATLPEEFIQTVTPVISKINPDVDRFSFLVDTLLDISRLNSRELILSKEQCDLSVLIQEILGRLLPEFGLNSTPLITQIEEDITGHFDTIRIQQVITNLLMNALKFGENKPVNFSVKKQDGIVIFEVADHGIGISHDDLERIFKPFERAVSDKNFGGLGLGLFITLQIIKAHNGRIDVASELGHGTTFTIRLPLDT